MQCSFLKRKKTETDIYLLSKVFLLMKLTIYLTSAITVYIFVSSFASRQVFLHMNALFISDYFLSIEFSMNI